jgi:DNA mismatch repair protein MutS
MSSAANDSTPLMKQYWELKSGVPDALLLFRMGDFYELFGDDAVEASKILEITLTSRDKGKANPIPMAGVPHHAVHGYLQRLLKAGRKVAIGEQMEDPSSAKGIVKREITRVFSPGVQFDLETDDSAWLATALPEEAGRWTLCCLDVSTGQAFYQTGLETTALLDELQRNPIRQLLRLGGRLPPEAAEALRPGALLEDLSEHFLAPAAARTVLCTNYGLQALEAFLPSETAIHALGVLVRYAAKSQRLEQLAHLQLPLPLHQAQSLRFGPQTAEHLDLFPVSDGRPNLLSAIQNTRSAAGARRLKRWLSEPLTRPEEIRQRQDAVRLLAGAPGGALQRLSQAQAEIYDLERILGRVHTGLANPRDTRALGASLRQIPALIDTLAYLGSLPSQLEHLKTELAKVSAGLAPLADRIVATQKAEAPLVSRDGGIFERGTDAELDRLIDLNERGSEWLLALEAREREATGIPSLKVKYNRVFGYFIEITQAHLKSAPAHYQRKQTTVGAERFFTDELKKFEEEAVTAQARQKALEEKLFADLLSEIRLSTRQITEAAHLLSELDALASLSALARRPGWVFPTVDDTLELEIRAGRHPLVDRGEFVPNDLRLDPQSRRTLLITGPNMGGKSTLMRQAALIVILGQMGAPVPAAAAGWGAVDAIYTRIGAQDAIARGQSTFMVEMTELAHLLHHAGERSLVILDEIGRGTSTYDGMSVAWATLEWICSRIRSRTLFATHYHELTRLVERLPELQNAHMAVESPGAKDSGELRFLYLLKEGPTNESFGIHVAKLAGLPKSVIDRAWEVLESLEGETRNPPAPSGPAAGAVDPAQLSFFGGVSPGAPAQVVVKTEFLPNPVGQRLRDLRIDELTPLQALNLLAELQRESVRDG